MAHGKERKNATLAQELLSEDTLQQLQKQEELWQLQNRKINFKNLHFWTHLVAAASSWRSSHPSNLMRIRFSGGSGLGAAEVLHSPWLPSCLQGKLQDDKWLVGSQNDIEILLFASAVYSLKTCKAA